MSSKEPKFQPSLKDEVSSFLEKKKREAGEKPVEFLNIIDFIDRFKLLPYGLFPAQRFVVKLYYNVPLDGVNKTIEVRDRFGEKVVHRFTEVEYLEYLYNQGRCNIRVQDSVERRELVLVLGRRSGKSELSSIFASYELYKLLRRGNPQSYYGMPGGSEIRVMCVANDKEQASIVYGSMQGHIDAVDYFKNAQANATQTFMRFRTDADRKKYGNDGKATVVATFKSSIAKGLRGRGIICSILDEIAFFVDDGKSSAEQVYKAITPSLGQFSPKDPKTNRPIILKDGSEAQSEGRMILISSPDAKEGFFYKEYQRGMSGGKSAANTLVIRAPTWEINPSLSRTYYEVEYNKNPKAFATEHGAEFSDRVRGWIEDFKDLEECIVPDLRPKNRGLPREAHWGGVDFGLQHDGTAIALTRLAGGKIELAYHEIWYPGVSWKEANPHLESPMTPYALTLQNVTRLDLDEIAEWFRVLSTRFYIQQAVFDQWAGPVFEQVLHKKGLTQFGMKNFTPAESSAMFQTFKMAMYNHQLALYDYPLGSDGETARRSPLIQELMELQATSGGKNITIVEAPRVSGKHDDQSDALARSIMLAMDFVSEHPGVLEASIRAQAAPSAQPRPVGYHQFHRARMRLHGPPDRTRMVPGRRR